MYTSGGNCFDEDTFNIDVLASPEIDSYLPVTSCDYYIIPQISGSNLTGSEAYYSGMDGQGEVLLQGDTIFTSVVLYAYDIVLDCPSEKALDIEIVGTPVIDPIADVERCGTYTLPPIAGIGVNGASYYDAANGQGLSYSEGDLITSSITLFAYVNAGDCNAEESFRVNILEVPEINDFPDVTSCDGYILPEITGSNLTGNEVYYTGSDGQGDTFFPGDTIFTSSILYAYDVVLDCSTEKSIDIEIVETPEIDPIENVEECDSYVL